MEDAFDVEDSGLQPPQAPSAQVKGRRKGADAGLAGAVKGVIYQSRDQCVACLAVPVRGHRWCVEHKRVEASMKFQAGAFNLISKPCSCQCEANPS